MIDEKMISSKEPYQERGKEENQRQHGYATSFSGQMWTWKEYSEQRTTEVNGEG